jgi:hypothetical protein
MYGDHDPTPGVQQVSGGVNGTHLALQCSSSTRKPKRAHCCGIKAL